jgi:hypothetical protein
MEDSSRPSSDHLGELIKDLFSLPEYQAAFSEVLDEAIYARASERDLVLATIPRRRESRTYRGRNSMPSGMVLDSEPLVARWQIEVEPSHVGFGDQRALVTLVDRMAQGYIAAVMPQLFAHMATVSAAAGTSLDAGGRPLSVDIIAEALEGMEIDFDDDGTPRPLQILAPPDMKFPSDTEEGQRKINAVIDRKRQQFFAQRRSRQLSGHPLRD